MAVFAPIVLFACQAEIQEPVMRGTAVPQSTIPITNENVTQLQELAYWPLNGHVRWSGGIALSPDDQKLAVSFDDVTDNVAAKILILDMANGNEIQSLHGHSNDVNSVSFSADGSQLASSSWDKTAKIWDLTSGKPTHSFNHPDTTYSAAFSPDGKLLATGVRDGSVTIWDIETGQKVFATNDHTELVQHVTFSPDGQNLVSASFDGTLRVWDIPSGEAMHILDNHEGSVWDIAFSLDETRAASASTDSTVRIWDTNSWQEFAALSESNPGITEFFDTVFIDDNLIAAASLNHITIWNAIDGNEILIKDIEDGPGPLTKTHDGRLLVTGGRNGLRLWGVPNNK